VIIPASPEFAAVGSPAPLAGAVISVLQLVNTGGALDGDAIKTAVGHISGFASANFDSTSGTGFSDNSANPIPQPNIAVGQGFFFDNLNAAAVTWTQVLNP
jgi:hypothetical protein